MANSDIPWRALVGTQLVLFALHIAFVLAVLHKPLTSAWHSYAIAFGIVGCLFLLAFRTIRWRGTIGTNEPHPDYPSGQHPKPRFQFAIGMWAFSALQLAMFWPYKPKLL